MTDGQVGRGFSPGVNDGVGGGYPGETKRWVRITTTDKIPPREGRAVCLGTREIAIFNLGDRFFATDNQCPHKGGPLSQGIVHNKRVTCPLHNFVIELASGQAVAPDEGCAHSHPAKVENGTVWLSVRQAAATPAE